MSQLTVEGQSTLESLEGMLGPSSSPQRCMAGVRTEDGAAALNGLIHFHNIKAIVIRRWPYLKELSTCPQSIGRD